MSGSQNAAGSVAQVKTHAQSPKVEGNVLSDAQLAAVNLEAEARGHKIGMAAGIAAERERMAGILGSDEAKEREDLARHFAFDSDVSAESARAALAKAPKATAAAPTKSQFEQRMDAGKNPVVGPDAPAGTEDEVGALVGTVMAAYRGQRSTRKGAN